MRVSRRNTNIADGRWIAWWGYDRAMVGVRYLEKDGMLARGWKMEREGTTGTTGQEYTVFIYELWKIQVSTAAVSSR